MIGLQLIELFSVWAYHIIKQNMKNCVSEWCMYAWTLTVKRVQHEQNWKPFSANCVGVHHKRHWKRQANLLALHMKSLSLIVTNCTGGIGGLGEKRYAFISLPIGSSTGINVLQKVALINVQNGKLCPSICSHTYLSNYQMKLGIYTKNCILLYFGMWQHAIW